MARESKRGTAGCLCPPLPPPSGISVASRAEAKEALVSVESEALSLIESHASVTSKALQSRKDLGATEAQTPPPSPAPPWRPCLSPWPSLTHEHGLGGSQGRRLEIPPFAPCLVQGHHTTYAMGLRILGNVYGASGFLVFISGDLLPSPVISLTGMSPSKQVLAMHHVSLVQWVFSILSFREDATSSPAPCSAPSRDPASPSVGRALYSHPVWR